MSLSKAKILAANDTKLSDPISVPEWGGDVYCKTLTGTERDHFEDAYSQNKMKSFRARFLVLTLCDDSGERLFADNEVDALGKKSSIIINRLFEKAWEHNAFTAEAVDSLGKDSPSDQSGDSISA
jgi:serine/threonine protein phosphatase PrpC